MDAVARLETEVRTRFIRGDMVMAVFLDISQAFDSVWHHGLLQKVLSSGIKGNMACFIQNFLTNRRIVTRVGTTLSTAYPVPNGVPQGSVISPTLFIIMLNDLFHTINNISYSLYADDCAIWVAAHSVEECTAAVTEALEAVSCWSEAWGLDFSPAKTKAILFTKCRKVILPDLLLCDTPIEFVTHYKFTGVIFDRQLSWRQHIYGLRDRCQGDLRLMAVISARGSGADFSILQRIYLMVVKPKLEYASFLFATACPTYLKMLDRIQYAAARIMLGALRSTPVHSLEVEAHLMPLALSRRHSLVQYMARILTIPHHPVRNLLLTYYPFHYYRCQKLPLPCVGRAYDEFQAMGHNFSSIPVIPTVCRLIAYELPVYMSLAVEQKSTLSPSQWRCLFTDKLSQFPSHNPVYTDGSLRGALCGAGAWSPTFSLMARLPPGSSVFTAELYAIYMTLTYLSLLPGKFIIFTDSLSSVSALRSVCRSSHYLVFRIAEILQSSSAKYTIEWVPSHQGIEGNERADGFARQACDLPTPLSLPIPLGDLRRLATSNLYKTWQGHWTASKHPLHDYTPTLGLTPSHLLPRQDQIKLSRLRLNTCLLTHKHHFTKSPRQQCSMCKVPLTISHLLIDCPSLEPFRDTIR
jgi:ribonuclease HI